MHVMSEDRQGICFRWIGIAVVKATAGSNLPRLEGALAEGETRSGWFTFDVATDSAGRRVRVGGEINSTSAVFALS